MPYYNKVDISKAIDLAKNNNSKDISFVIIGFLIMDTNLKILNCFHDLTVLSLNLSNIVIITIRIVDSCCTTHNISKYEAINLSKNYILEYHRYIYKNIKS